MRHKENRDKEGAESLHAVCDNTEQPGILGTLSLTVTELPPPTACMPSRFSRVRLYAIPWTVSCQAPLSMGILQARILEWVAMPSSRGSS